MKYSTIVADPPWPYNDKSGPRAAPDNRPNSWNKNTGAVGSALRYGSMSIKRLLALPIHDFAENNAHLYLWTTNSFLVEGHQIMKAWGFNYKTTLTWVKMKPDGTPSMKAGHYFRGATEHVLFGVRGKLKLQGGPAPTAHLSRRLPHSIKPEWFYNLVEQQSPSPRLELFARQKRLGWHSWGNEIPSDIELRDPA